MKIVKGNMWLIDYSRKGRLLVEILSQDEEFVTVKILSGKVRYASIGNNFDQKVFGVGTEGDTITVRKSFITWVRKEKVPS